MVQKINDIINTSYVTVVPRREEEMIATLLTKKNVSPSFSFLSANQIDFKEIKINGNVIEVLRMPGTFSPFRAYGKIKFNLLRSEEKDHTNIKCEIYPGNNSIPYLILYQVLVTGLLAVLFWIMGRDLTTKFIGALIVVIIPALISYSKYVSTKRELIDYSRVIIKLMRD